MKIQHYIYLALIMIISVQCKQNDWIDWKTENELFMLQNGQQEGIQTTPSGLQYKVIYPGNLTDTRPVIGSTVVYDYKLSLINNNVLQQQQNFSAYFATGLNGMIDGMVEGLKKMHVGADYILYIPWELAYGEDGNGTEGNSSFIPPYSTLIFEVHLSRVYY